MELLDIRQLRAFQELARKNSFTEAANHLHLTQSAVSHSIKSLETQLQVTLFERLGKKALLTGEGQALLPHVDAIISRMEKAVDDVVNSNRPGHGRLRIGTTATISQYALPSILRELRESFPNYEITVTTASDRQLLDLLENGHLDSVIALKMQTVSRIAFEPIFIDRIEMAISAIHPLAKSTIISIDQVINEDFIICDGDSDTFRLIEKAFFDAKSRLHSSLQVGSMAAIKEMARIGLGIGLIPSWIALDEINSGSLVFQPLPFGEATRTWGIYTDSRQEPSLIDSVFFGITRNVFENLKVRTDQFELCS